jgi:hypothetical protein
VSASEVQGRTERTEAEADRVRVRLATDPADLPIDRSSAAPRRHSSSYSAMRAGESDMVAMRAAAEVEVEERSETTGGGIHTRSGGAWRDEVRECGGVRTSSCVCSGCVSSGAVLERVPALESRCGRIRSTGGSRLCSGGDRERMSRQGWRHTRRGAWTDTGSCVCWEVALFLLPCVCACRSLLSAEARRGAAEARARRRAGRRREEREERRRGECHHSIEADEDRRPANDQPDRMVFHGLAAQNSRAAATTRRQKFTRRQPACVSEVSSLCARSAQTCVPPSRRPACAIGRELCVTVADLQQPRWMSCAHQRWLWALCRSRHAARISQARARQRCRADRQDRG